ncbi:MAG: hypothetical protein MUF73_17940 [Rhodobacteraceae bacterium]|jgi:hypothetical protein|nr:hypothetical protein [Paracoccaceae bacterium]
MQTIRHKRGDTFSRRVFIREADGTTAINLTGFTLSSSVEGRGPDGPFTQALTVTLIDAATGEAQIDQTAVNCRAWPVTPNGGTGLFCDIRRVQGAVERRTPTFQIVVDKEVTPWPT